jgi:hypothetical protein
MDYNIFAIRANFVEIADIRAMASTLFFKSLSQKWSVLGVWVGS